MNTTSGLEKAWETLAAMEPVHACRQAAIEHNSGIYTIASLGMRFDLDTKERAIRGQGPEARALHQKHAYFMDLALLNYITTARNIAQAGKHIKPQNLKGGHHFFTGAHELPLKDIAARYGSDLEGFHAKASELGSRRLDFGDASVELAPLPRVPVTVILWASDEEFPARADLLFDTMAEYQAKLDILWSAAMFSLLAML